MVHEVCSRAGITYRGGGGKMALANAQRLLSMPGECNAPPGEGLTMTRANIKKAFAALALLTHPDKNDHRSEETSRVYEAAFRAVTAAYEVAGAEAI